MRTTLEDRVIEYMKEYGGITSMDAFRDLGVTRLSAVIFTAKKHGHEIETTWESSRNRYGDPVSFVRYSLKGEGKAS